MTAGSIVSDDSSGSAAFRPRGLRFFSLTLTQGPSLAAEAFACLDCGLVWSSTSTDKLEAFIVKHCEAKA